MSSALTGNHPTKNPVIAWAAAVFMAQSLLIGAPVVLHAGKVEARLQNVERQAEGYTSIIERLTRVETKQDQILEAIHGRPARRR